MLLLSNLQLGESIAIQGDVSQSVQEDPNIILEQLIFESTLRFEDCCEKLHKILSIEGERVESPSKVVVADSAVFSCRYRTPSKDVALQVVSEHPDGGCAGFIHSQIRWEIDSAGSDV